MCLASADIECPESRLIHALEGEQMSIGDVEDVNVIAEATAIGRVVVGAIDVELRTTSACRLHQQRDEMGFGIMQFSLHVGGATGIEIAKRDDAETVCDGIPAKDPFEGQLTFAIRIHR